MIPPDVELLVSSYLRDNLDVTMVVSRIGTRTPATTADPWIRISQIGDEQASSPLYLIRALVQIDCYGFENLEHGQEWASQIARTVRAALDVMDEAQHEGAVVTDVRSSMRRMPDDAFKPARERFIVQATITCHPA